MFYEFFFSPQLKRSVIISNEHGIYERLAELPNDLRLWILISNYGLNDFTSRVNRYLLSLGSL